MKKIDNIFKDRKSILYILITSGSILGGVSLYLPSDTTKFIPIFSLCFLMWFTLRFIRERKKKSLLLIICILLILINLFSIFSYSPIHEYQLRKINEKAEYFIENGRYLDSIQLLQHQNTQDLFDKTSMDTRARRLLFLSISNWREDSLDRALELIIEANNTVNPKNDVLRGEIFSTMGNIYNDRNEYNLAEKFFKEAIKRGNNSPEIEMDLLICLKNQGRLYNSEQIYNVINKINNENTIKNQIILSQGYRLLANISSEKEKKEEYYYNAYTILSNDDYLTDRRLQSFTDWIMVKYEDRDDYSENDLEIAYMKAVEILNQNSTKKDIDRAKIDMSIKMCILYKDLASMTWSDDLFFKSIEILESTRDLVKNQSIDPNIRLKWWLNRIDLYSLKEDLSNMMISLDEAEKIVIDMNLYDRKNLNALTEFYQVKGLINHYYADQPGIDTDHKIAMSYLLKTFSLKYLFEVGDLRDYRRTVSVLKGMGVTGLPDNFMIIK